MTRRSGSADLPLHGGHVPQWLADRMTRLGVVISEAVIQHYGRTELLRRLSHPCWFQAFGAVMGMDWHSSGVTTSVVGALKRGLAPRSRELGVHICGGRGRHSRRTPEELAAVAARTGLDGEALARTSRLVAKVDGAAVQDGYDIYLHAFIVTDEGEWTVVQQGMQPASKTARRYHWLSEGLKDFVDEPHAAIDGESAGTIVNLTDRRAAAARAAQVTLATGDPGVVIQALRKRREVGPEPAPEVASSPLPHLQLPEHHEVRASDVLLRRIHGTLSAAAERGPVDFADLLLTPGLGPRTVEALAYVSEIIHGAPSRFSDPARYSLAHGGKDGHPFPVPLKVYDETIRVLKDAVEKARLGQQERLGAIRRLDEQAREVERWASGPAFDLLVARERARSRELGGKTV